MFKGLIGTRMARVPAVSPWPRRSHLPAPPARPLKAMPLHPPTPADRGGDRQFCAPPNPFIASVIPAGLSMICEKRTTVTVSSVETSRP